MSIRYRSLVRSITDPARVLVVAPGPGPGPDPEPNLRLPAPPFVFPVTGSRVDGTADPGEFIQVYVGGLDSDPVGSAFASLDGSWSVYFQPAPLPGETLFVTATNTAGVSEPTVVTVQEPPADGLPRAPVVEPTDGSVISGSTPGSMFLYVVFDIGADGVEDSQVYAAYGSFTFYPEEVIPEGTVVRVFARNEAGDGPHTDVVVQSAEVINKPDKPIVYPSYGEYIAGGVDPSCTVEIDIGDDGTIDYTTTPVDGFRWSVFPAEPIPGGTLISVVARNAWGVSDPVVIAVGEYAGEPWPADPNAVPGAPVVTGANSSGIDGNSEPGSVIEVDLNADGTTEYDTITSPDGRWYVSLTSPVGNGTEVNVYARNLAGVSEPFTFTYGAEAPVVFPTDGTVIAGTAVPGYAIRISVVDSFESFYAYVGDDGSWSTTPWEPLLDGAVLSVVAEGPYGAAEPVFVTVEGGQVIAPLVVFPTDGVTLSGTAQPGARIVIYADGEWYVDSEVYADENGDWSVTFAEPYADGVWIQVSADGGQNYVNVMVDGGTVTQPLVVFPTDGVTLSGTARPNSVIEYYADSVFYGHIFVDENGDWSETFAGPHAPGVLIQVTDDDGETYEYVFVGEERVPGPVPVAPVVNPTDGRTLSGTAEPLSTIVINSFEANTRVDASGNWSFYFSLGFPLDYSMVVQALNPGGPGAASEVQVGPSLTPAIPAGEFWFTGGRQLEPDGSYHTAYDILRGYDFATLQELAVDLPTDPRDPSSVDEGRFQMPGGRFFPGLSPDGTRLSSGCYDTHAREYPSRLAIIDALTGATLAVPESGQGISGRFETEWDPSGDRLAFQWGSWNDYRFRVVDTQDWSVVVDLPGTDGFNRCLWSNSGDLFATHSFLGYGDDGGPYLGEVNIYRTSDWALVGSFETEGPTSVESATMSFSRDDAYLAIGAQFVKDIVVIETETMTRLPGLSTGGGTPPSDFDTLYTGSLIFTDEYLAVGLSFTRRVVRFPIGNWQLVNYVNLGETVHVSENAHVGALTLNNDGSLLVAYSFLHPFHWPLTEVHSYTDVYDTGTWERTSPAQLQGPPREEVNYVTR